VGWDEGERAKGYTIMNLTETFESLGAHEIAELAKQTWRATYQGIARGVRSRSRQRELSPFLERRRKKARLELKEAARMVGIDHDYFVPCVRDRYPLLELRDVGVIESVGNMIDENEPPFGIS
jgi:hypothetical protein